MHVNQITNTIQQIKYKNNIYINVQTQTLKSNMNFVP